MSLLYFFPQDFPIHALLFSCYNVNQQTHTLHQNHNNVLIHKLLQLSGPMDPSSGSAQLYKAIVQTFYRLQYALELS